MEFNKRLQELRKNRNMTQEELASRLFVSLTAVSKWESGKGYPEIESLKAISSLFGVSLDTLLSNDEILVAAQSDSKNKLRRFLDLTYGLFEYVVVNYRPVLINGWLEASYPSSTTLIALTTGPTAAM